MVNPVFDAAARTFTDAAGTTLTEEQVAEQARRNIRGSMSYDELLDDYINNLAPEELGQWAADENGELPIPF